MRRIAILWFVTAVVVTGLRLSATGEEDYWTPSGAPGTEEGKMKTLDQVEPRTPIVQLPFVIEHPGSYYLIHGLNGVEGSNGIIIAASEVQLDMNGFGLFGGSNTAHGIYVQPSQGPGPTGKQFSISIRNGAIIEWDGWGINATNADQSEFINLKVMMNGEGGTGGGIGVGGSCQLVQCSAGNNGTDGIITEFDGTITDCKAVDNGNNGITTGPGNRISGCTVVQNTMDGIITTEGATITDCKSVENGGNGIKSSHASRISGCTAANNDNNGISVETYCTIRDCLAAFNVNNGIVVGWSCLVTDNNCGDNGSVSSNGSGIVVLNSGNRVENNNLTANYKGIEVMGEGNWIGNNTVIDNTLYGIIVTNANNMVVRNATGTHDPGGTNYLIDAGNNQFGFIRPYASGSFTNADPWANFRIMPGP